MPKSNIVYVKDVEEFRNTSEEQQVELDAKDEKFFKEFSTGAVPIRWQKEMIDSGVFDELNARDSGAALKSSTCMIL